MLDSAAWHRKVMLKPSRPVSPSSPCAQFIMKSARRISAITACSTARRIAVLHPRRHEWLVVLLTAACVFFSAPSHADGDEYDEKIAKWKKTYEEQILPIIEARCVQCHRGEKIEGEFDLGRFANSDAAVEAGDAWERVARRIRLNEMPPQGSPGLNDQQKGRFQRWVDSRPGQDLCRQLASEETQSWYRGHVMSRRLTQTEYRNAVRDLTGLELLPNEVPPSDGAGGEGFDTTGDALFTSTIHLESWLMAADRLIERAIPDDPSASAPDSPTAVNMIVGRTTISRDNAPDVIRYFARRAWRRPVSDDEVERLMGLFNRSHERTGSLMAALREPLKAILVSPHFLFVVETEPGEAGVMQLAPHQLATRLALFLWSSVPDEELLRSADSGQILDEDHYRLQIRRMLAHPSSRALGENFGLQWMGLRNFGDVQPDPLVFAEYNPDLANDMREEAIGFVTSVFRDNRPLTDLISANDIYVNGRLAKYYGIDLPDNAPWQTVAVTDGRRGGVITMAGVLTAASYPRRTSPVLRGRWILDELLGTPVPPPPPNVPALDESEADINSFTLRQRLEQHRQRTECASCHDRMDPLGFGLENFDGIGRWRNEDSGVAIDSAGQLPSGETFSGPAELKSVLMNRSGDFRRHFVRKLLGFALGRELNKFDVCVIDSSLKKLDEHENRSHVLIEEIAMSYPFQYRYYRESEPVAEVPQSRGARLLEGLRRLSEKAESLQKQNDADTASVLPPQEKPQ